MSFNWWSDFVLIDDAYAFCQDQADVAVEDELVAKDMQVLGCLMVELFLSANTHALGYGATLEQRYQLARSVCTIYGQDLPR